MAASSIDIYRRQIERELQAGNATEHTHRPALKSLIESLAPGLTATNEPRRIACGAPDFNIARGKIPLGHMETKDVGANLEEMESCKGPHGEQFKRYRDGLPNWILTDYLEFRWFVGGEKRLTARIASPDSKGKMRTAPDGENQLAQLLDAFFKQEALTVGTAKDLAQRMAGMTRIVCDLIIRTFEHEQEKGWLHNWLAAFREVLIPDLDEKQFADMFAQTLAYGLFAAKVHSGSGKPFSREMAAFSLPKTNPFLRKLFSEIGGVDMPETIDWAVDDIVELLKQAEMSEILKDFGKGKGKEDPVVHFYETFLAAYDPKMRELRGVYYTPEPVVSYIVRSIDHLLKTRFSRPKGLADENTLILDPATGTATFLYFVIERIYEKFANQRGAWDSYVGSHLLNRIFGFELLMAPYAVAHLKLGMELRQTGYTFASDQRLGIYLTNTLEQAAKKSEQLFANWISAEAEAATQIKRDLPIMVVLGNPPYSGHSANRSWEMKNGKRTPTFIGQLIQDYYKVDGQPLGEKNPKWLQDDYVKFIRWGQWRIERTGAGILALITNHGYLDNPTFRGMRRSLMNLFTDIYVLNLHGNSKKKEKCPDGSPDENVFDIQQGVTLGIFIKDQNKAGQAKVFHAHLWGLRERKYQYLFERDVEATRWTELRPQSPNYLFVPQNINLLAEYEKGWKIPEAFPLNSVGIVTARDNLTVGWTGEQVWNTVRDFVNLNPEAARQKYELGKDARDWKVGMAQEDVRSDGPKSENIIALLYRPFDSRFTYYTGRSRGFICMPRPEVMPNMIMGRNIGLVWTRPMSPNYEFSVISTRFVIDQCAVGNKTAGAGISYLGPLYVHDSESVSKGDQIYLHKRTFDGARRPNLNHAFLADLEKQLGLSFVPDGKGDLKKNFGPEDVFDYIYALFHSPTYRTRYAEFLKSDFPRVPLTSDVNLFRVLCAKGAELVALHLLESPKLEKPIARYPVKGSNLVDKGFPKYVAPGEPEPVFVAQGSPSNLAALPRLKEGRVYINKATVPPVSSPATGDETSPLQKGQYFEVVPPEVWNFHIGGYQVCEKWLKDRRGRNLTYDDLTHYAKVVTALNETIRLMAEIDAAIPKWPIE